MTHAALQGWACAWFLHDSQCARSVLREAALLLASAAASVLPPQRPCQMPCAPMRTDKAGARWMLHRVCSIAANPPQAPSPASRAPQTPSCKSAFVLSVMLVTSVEPVSVRWAQAAGHRAPQNDRSHPRQVSLLIRASQR